MAGSEGSLPSSRYFSPSQVFFYDPLTDTLQFTLALSFVLMSIWAQMVAPRVRVSSLSTTRRTHAMPFSSSMAMTGTVACSKSAKIASLTVAWVVVVADSWATVAEEGLEVDLEAAAALEVVVVSVEALVAVVVTAVPVLDLVSEEDMEVLQVAALLVDFLPSLLLLTHSPTLRPLVANQALSSTSAT